MDATTLVRIKFESPAIAWEGHCDGISTTCKVCQDFDYGRRNARCQEKGIRQECWNGRWVKQEAYHRAVSPELPGLPSATAPVVICFVICGIMAFIIIIITSLIWCATLIGGRSSKPAVTAGTSSTAATAQVGSPVYTYPPAIARVCPACGAERGSDNAFCVQCGQRFEDQV